jgi:hypothetical protein
MSSTQENQELEKHHQVLNHKENQLHNEMDPLDKTIEKEVREIAAMDTQLEAAHKKTTDQNDLISQMQQTLKTVIERERTQQRRRTSSNSYFEQMKYDLHEVVQHFHAKDELKSLFLSFHNKYMKNEKVEDIQLDEDVEEEHRRQKTTLQKQLKELRQQHVRDDVFQTKEQGRLLLQNAALIDELQGLRAANKQLISQASITKKPMSGDRTLLPATEAQRKIDENKRRIARLEEQLAAYNETPPIVRPS